MKEVEMERKETVLAAFALELLKNPVNDILASSRLHFGCKEMLIDFCREEEEEEDFQYIFLKSKPRIITQREKFTVRLQSSLPVSFSLQMSCVHREREKGGMGSSPEFLVWNSLVSSGRCFSSCILFDLTK